MSQFPHLLPICSSPFLSTILLHPCLHPYPPLRALPPPTLRVQLRTEVIRNGKVAFTIGRQDY